MRVLMAAVALLLSASAAAAFCRTPEAIISGFDHSEINAAFSPLYGAVGLDVIARANEILAATGIDGRLEGNAALIAEPKGDDLFYVYVFRGNCHVGSARFSREFINLVLGKGA